MQVDLSPHGCFGSDRWRRGDPHSNRTQIDAEVVRAPRDDHAPNPIDHRRAAAACCVEVPDERWDVISRRARSRRCVATPRHA